MPKDSDAAAPTNTIAGFDIRTVLAYIATGILTMAFVATNIIVFQGTSGEGWKQAFEFAEKGQILTTTVTIILALPIGVVVNASSFTLCHFLVAYLARLVCQWLVHHPFPFSPVMGGLIGQEVVRSFSIKDGYEFQDKGTVAVEMLKMYLPSAYRSYQHIIGLAILFRVSFMLCVVEAILLFLNWGMIWGVSAVIVALFLLVSAALEYVYLYSHLLFVCHLVGRHQLNVPAGGDVFERFLDTLAAEASAE